MPHSCCNLKLSSWLKLTEGTFLRNVLFCSFSQTSLCSLCLLCCSVPSLEAFSLKGHLHCSPGIFLSLEIGIKNSQWVRWSPLCASQSAGGFAHLCLSRSREEPNILFLTSFWALIIRLLPGTKPPYSSSKSSSALKPNLHF